MVDSREKASAASQSKAGTERAEPEVSEIRRARAPHLTPFRATRTCSAAEPLRNTVRRLSPQREVSIAARLAWAVTVACSIVVLGGCSSSPTVGSIGAVLSRDRLTGAAYVRQAPRGLAAQSSGLIPGDRIKMVDGVLVDHLDDARLKELLRGPMGSKIVLTVIRADRVFDLEITRQALLPAGSLRQRHTRID